MKRHEIQKIASTIATIATTQADTLFDNFDPGGSTVCENLIDILAGQGVPDELLEDCFMMGNTSENWEIWIIEVTKSCTK